MSNVDKAVSMLLGEADSLKALKDRRDSLRAMANAEMVAQNRKGSLGRSYAAADRMRAEARKLDAEIRALERSMETGEPELGTKGSNVYHEAVDRGFIKVSTSRGLKKYYFDEIEEQLKWLKEDPDNTLDADNLAGWIHRAMLLSDDEELKYISKQRAINVIKRMLNDALAGKIDKIVFNPDLKGFKTPDIYKYYRPRR